MKINDTLYLWIHRELNRQWTATSSDWIWSCFSAADLRWWWWWEVAMRGFGSLHTPPPALPNICATHPMMSPQSLECLKSWLRGKMKCQVSWPFVTALAEAAGNSFNKLSISIKFNTFQQTTPPWRFNTWHETITTTDILLYLHALKQLTLCED